MEALREELARVDPEGHQAPVDIKLAETVPAEVPDLEYENYGNTPIKMKLNNTGYTVTVSGKFESDAPIIKGGPLEGPYKFSQLHFHWGPSDEEGSEHTFDGRCCPLEMHVVHVNQKYGSQEEALLQRDGVVIAAFPFIKGAKHAGLDGITRGLSEIAKPQTSFKISPQPLLSVVKPFARDYFSYWGSVTSPSCSHLIQWLVSREPLEASPEQFAAFRQLLNVNEEPLLRNYRDGQALGGRTVFHLAPAARDGFTLHCGAEQLSAAVAGRPSGELADEQACTSLDEVESKGVINVDPETGERIPERTASGRLVERTPSGRLVERTTSGRLLEKTPSGRLVERTDSGRLLEKTESGRLLEKTESGRLVETVRSERLEERTPSGRLVQKTPSGRLVEKTPSGRLVEKTESGRFVEKTPSGRLVEKTESGRYVEKTPSGRLVEKTESGRLLEKTDSGRLLEKTESGRLVETVRSERIAERTPSGRLVEKTPSGRLVEKTPSGHLVEKTPSGRLVEKTPSGRVLEKTPSGRYVETLAPERLEERTPSGRLLEKTPSGRMVERTPSGRLVEKTPSGRLVEKTPSGRMVEKTPSGRIVVVEHLLSDKTTSGRLLSSRASFSQVTGPTKERSADEWPDAPFTGKAVQSPVFLHTADAVRLACPPLEFLGHFKTGVGLMLTNSGETVEISLLQAAEADRPVLQGGPLQGRYKLDSAHFHWLPNDDVAGGTHTINNARAEIECHLVHVHENYKSKTEAMKHPNGMAVVSILHQVGGAECEVFKRLCNELPRIDELYTQVQLPGMDLSYLATVVKPHEYFLYPGRFFGREDGEALVWIVFAEPIGICCQNVAAFRRLKLSLDFKQHETAGLDGRPLYAVIAEEKAAGMGDGGAAADGAKEGAEAGAGGAAAAQMAGLEGQDAGQMVGGAAAQMAGGGGPGGGGGPDEEMAVGGLRRTASGRVQGLSANEWPNAPHVSKHQMLMAPLDIQTSSVPSVPMPPLEYRGHFPAQAVPVVVRNTGEAVDLTWKDTATLPKLVGGPLPDEYIFDSAHFHWSQNPEDVGSMHRVNGKRTSLEFHMVHYKKSLRTRQEAMFVPDGLAVTSFLLDVGGEENGVFTKLTDVLSELVEVDAAADMDFEMGWLQSRAGPHGYFTYPGTLFGADQGINVIWIVYPTPVQICCQNIAQFYKLECLDNERMHPLHEPLDRPIFYSINPDNCTS